MLLKFFNRNIILILLSINLIILLTDLSASVFKLSFFIFIILIFFVKNNYNIEVASFKNKLLGLNFFSFYFIANILGFSYGYSINYVLIDLIIVVPVLSVYFIDERDINSEKILKWIKVFAIITAVFSIIMFFYWRNIDFLKKIVQNQDADSESTEMLSRFYNTQSADGRNIRATGIFKDAYQNGLFILMGVIIAIEDLIKKKKSLLYTILLCLIFGISIYTTQTRNIYFLSFMIIASYLYLYFQKGKYQQIYSFILIVVYLLMMLLGIYFSGNNLQEGASLYARYYSWNIIIHEYLLNKLLTSHFWIGYGLIQFESTFSPNVTYWKIDNSIMATFLGGGIICVFFFLRWVNFVYRYLIRTYNHIRHKECRSMIRIIILFFMIYFLGGAMNVNVYDIFFVLPMLLLLKRIYFLINNKGFLNTKN